MALQTNCLRPQTILAMRKLKNGKSAMEREYPFMRVVTVTGYKPTDPAPFECCIVRSADGNRAIYYLIIMSKVHSIEDYAL